MKTTEKTNSTSKLKMTRRLTAASALAEHLGWDQPEVTEMRYQSTRNRQSIYVIGDDYMTGCAVGKKPKPFDGYLWEKVDSWITDKYGWEIYKASAVSE